MTPTEARTQWKGHTRLVLEAENAIDFAHAAAARAHADRRAFMQRMIQELGDEVTRDVIMGRVS